MSCKAQPTKCLKPGSQAVLSKFICIYENENPPIIKSSYISASKVQKTIQQVDKEQSIVSQYMYLTESVNPVARRGSSGGGKARHDEGSIEWHGKRW